MGRYSADDGLGLEFLGLLTPSNAAADTNGPIPAPQPTVPSESWSLGLGESEPIVGTESPAQGTVPLTRREARALEEARLAAVVGAPAAPSLVADRRQPTEDHTLTRRSPTRRTSSQIAPARRTSTATVRPRKTAQPGHPRAHISAGSKLLSLGALLFAGALVFGMSVPVNAVMSNASPVAASVGGATPRQSQLVDISSAAPPVATARDNFTVISYADIMRQQYGNVAYTFTPTTGAVRWPFPYSVPISDGWGARVQPCAGCSTFHQGVDFTPGGGTPIYAIADGVVASHDDTNYGLGNNVMISHLINGQHVDSVYAHMLTGSSKLQPGDIIKVGDFVGLVGDTGSSTGNHLHFEIHIDKVPVDPFAWLTANAVN